MTFSLTDSIVLKIMDEMNVVTTLPTPSVTGIIKEVLNGASKSDVINPRKQDLEDRSTLGSLEDIRYIADYAIAIKAIYEVIVCFGGRSEVKETIARLREVAIDVLEYLNEAEIKSVLERLKILINENK